MSSFRSILDNRKIHGIWFGYSKIDPRFDFQIEVDNLVISAGVPDIVKKKINELKAEYGELPVDHILGAEKY